MARDGDGVQDETTVGGRNAALDGLRGYAALTVVFYHTLMGAKPALVGSVLDPPIWFQRDLPGLLEKLYFSIFNGEVAVQIFFVMSGLVLVRSLRVGHRLGWWATSWRFTVKRVLRIWPVTAVCLIVHVAAYRAVDLAWPGTLPQFGLRQLLDNLLLVEPPTVNGATWTLHVEMLMVPVLLLCALLARHLGGALAVGGLLLWGFGAFKLHGLVGWDGALQTGFVFFVLGAGIELGLLDRLVRSRAAGPAAGLAMAGLLGSTLLLPHALSLRLGLQMVFVTVLVGWACTARDGAALRVLRRPVSQWLGRISFSLYLWNVPVFEAMLALIGDTVKDAHPLLVSLVVAPAAILVALPLAGLSERWLERPSIRLGRRMAVQTEPALPRPAPHPA